VERRRRPGFIIDKVKRSVPAGVSGHHHAGSGEQGQRRFHDAYDS
jgi:hypothetical protein